MPRRSKFARNPIRDDLRPKASKDTPPSSAENSPPGGAKRKVPAGRGPESIEMQDLSSVAENPEEAVGAPPILRAPDNARSGGGTDQGPSGTTSFPLYRGRQLDPYKQTFYKSHRVATLPYAVNCFKAADNCFFDTIMATYMAEIPVSVLELYMSRQEFQMLPQNCYATDCHVVVIGQGMRTTFATGTASSSTANSNQVCYGAYMVNPEKHFNTCVHTVGSTKMTINVIGSKAWCEDRFYGGNNEIGTQQGAIRNLPNYLCFSAPVVGGKICKPLLRQFATTFPIVEAKDQVIIDYYYKFQNGLLKTEPPTLFGPSGDMSAIMTMHNDVSYKERRIPIKYGLNDTQDLCNQQLRPDYQTDVTAYEDDIEKSLYMAQNYKDTRKGHMQPRVYLGIMPIQNNIVGATTPSWAEGQAFWEIQASLDITFHPQCAYSNAQTPFANWLFTKAPVKPIHPARQFGIDGGAATIAGVPAFRATKDAEAALYYERELKRVYEFNEYRDSIPALSTRAQVKQKYSKELPLFKM